MLSIPPARFATVTSRSTASWGAGASAQDLADLPVGHHPRQAVGAEQDPVPVGDLDVALVHDHALVDAEGPREDAPVGMRLRLLGRDLPFHHHLVDERVVLGEQSEISPAEQVRAGIADVREMHAVVVDECRGERGAHPRHAPIVAGTLEHDAVRLGDLVRQRALPLLEQLLDGLERERGRDLAAAMATHPVGDRVEGRDDQERVFVALADLADIRRRADDDLHRASSSVVLPRRTTSPTCTSTGVWSRRSFR